MQRDLEYAAALILPSSRGGPVEVVFRAEDHTRVGLAAIRLAAEGVQHRLIP